MGTVLEDNPRLDVRLWEGPDPVRVVVDTRLRTPASAALFQTGSGEVLIATGRDPTSAKAIQLKSRGASVVRVQTGPHGIDLRCLLRILWERGIERLLVEGGSEIITSFIRDRAVDKLVIFVAPRIVGKGVEAIGDLSVHSIDEALLVNDVEVERVGADFIVRGKPVWPQVTEG